eukprot:m51a1_g5214 hypothetical protein (510) ;mRNA; f:252634-254470
MNSLRTKHCQDLLAAIGAEPRALFHWMLWCTEIPRPSGSTAQMRDALVEVAKRMGLEHATDAAGNVRIAKKATPGYESAPGVVLQAHIDMVAVSDAERPSFAPETDAVHPYVAEADGSRWLRARGTSLGADDGMGIAMMLALLESPTARHPRLACVFTNDEETTMSGVGGLTPAFIGDAKYLINCDSEDAGVLCLGCAGGASVDYTMPVTRSAVAPGTAALRLRLSGLSGGHTGVHIHCGRANALRTLARVLLHACGGRHAGARLASLVGGTATNAITSSAEAVVVLPAEQAARASELAAAEFEAWRTEYRSVEPVARVALEVEELAQAPADAVSAEETRRVLHFWTLAPNEPLRMSPDIAGFVESSCAFTMCELPAGAHQAVFRGLARTSRDSQWTAIEQRLHALAELVGAEVSFTDRFPGWLPQPASQLAKSAVAAYERISGGRRPEVLSVHAGLECGFILQIMPHIEAISIGPQVEHPHSTEERCRIDSCTEAYNWLVEILASLTA